MNNYLSTLDSAVYNVAIVKDLNAKVDQYRSLLIKKNAESRYTLGLYYKKMTTQKEEYESIIKALNDKIQVLEEHVDRLTQELGSYTHVDTGKVTLVDDHFVQPQLDTTCNQEDTIPSQPNTVSNRESTPPPECYQMNTLNQEDVTSLNNSSQRDISRNSSISDDFVSIPHTPTS
jgi:hypothetical protein